MLTGSGHNEGYHQGISSALPGLFLFLYRRVKRRLWFCTPSTDALPEQLQVLNKQERLIVTMRFSTGLSVVESGKILGLSQEEYRKRVDDIMCKSMSVGMT